MAKGTQKIALLDKYIDKLNPDCLDGVWEVGNWNKIHGDHRSTSRGTCVALLMKRSDGKFVAKVEHNNVAIIELVYDEEPSMTKIGEDIKAKNEELGK